MNLEKLDSDLRLFRMNNEKPNFAALAREYGVDYRTVKRHWMKGEMIITRNKGSKLDDLKSLIKDKLSIVGCTVKGVYEYLIDQNLYGGSYSNFRKYVKKYKLQPKVVHIGHPRFETEPGVQAQADWKENITLTSKYGEVFTFNIFNIELAYSRLNYFELSIRKEQSDVFRCLLHSFQYFGGVPKEILFDNMPTASTHEGKGKHKVNPRMRVFARDVGFEVKLCKPGASYTKGKVESRNKIIDWILPYNNEFKDLNELSEIVRKINQKANTQICQSTNRPPTLLFGKEKEYLSPLPKKVVIETYQSYQKTVVGKDSTIYFKGNKYSVDPALIGETVGYEEFDNKLHIYYNLKLVTIHDVVTGIKQIKYHEEHYKKMYVGRVKDEDLDTIVRRNLDNLDKLTGGYNDI